jgi:VWFA-related protein
MRRTPLRLAAALVFVAGAVPGRATAQPSGKSDVVQETARVTVVEVPVNVVGRDGRPVAGLSAADFELYDDGKKQTISGFEAVDLSRPTAHADAAAAPVPPAARRHWLLVFDLSYTSLTGVIRAREGAEAFIARAMKESDLAAVATVSVEKGWNLLANFSSDKNQLTAAVRTLGLPGLTARSSDPLGLLFTAPTEATQTGFSNNPKNSMLEDFKELQQTLQKPANDAQARGKVASLLRSLAGMGHVLDSVRGRKHVLFFSEGFETKHLVGATPMSGSTGTNVFDRTAPTNEAANSVISGEIWKVDSDARFGSTASRSVLTQALGEFRRSDTILDTIDISGLRAEGDASGAKPGSGADALYTMATETDGDFIRNANQLGGEIEKLVDRTSMVYVLAFQASPSGRPGAFHPLKVKVRAPGARVLARAGYYEPRPYVALSPLERILASGDLITGGARENSLSTDLLCTVMPGGEVARVPLVLEIAGAPLLAASPGGGSARTVQIYAYATNSSGTLSDYLSQEMTLDLARVRGSLESGGIKFYGALTLPPGDYTVRTLVRDAASGRSAVSSASVRVPAAGGPGLVLPPFFPDRSGRWLFVRAATRPDAAARPTEYAFTVEGESFVPAVKPVLASKSGTAPAQVTVLTYRLGSGAPAGADPLQVAAEIIGSDGKPRPPEVSVVKRIDGEKSGARAVMLAFSPERLEPGRYALKVRVSDRATRQSGEASTDFEVR